MQLTVNKDQLVKQAARLGADATYNGNINIGLSIRKRINLTVKEKLC
jgi:hypothetical protein